MLEAGADSRARERVCAWYTPPTSRMSVRERIRPTASRRNLPNPIQNLFRRGSVYKRLPRLTPRISSPGVTGRAGIGGPSKPELLVKKRHDDHFEHAYAYGWQDLKNYISS